MKLSYEQVAAAMRWHDPQNLQWRSRDGKPLPPSAESRLIRLRTSATLSMLGRSVTEAFEQFRKFADLRSLGSIDQLQLGDRRPLVLAHGPSLSSLLPAIRTNRDELCLIAPLRTALHLAAGDIWADVIVLADRGTTPYAISATAWAETSATIRARLQQSSSLIVEPFAPASVYGGFERLMMLDDGTSLDCKNIALPFWGSALLASVALPLALGASSVAVGGIDLKSRDGLTRRTWQGERTKLDPRFATILALLEVFASTDRTLIDVTSDSIVKRGFSQISLETYAQSPNRRVAPDRPRVGSNARLASVLDEFLDYLEAQGPVVEAMRATADRGLALATGPDKPETRRQLAKLLATVERDWPKQPGMRTVMTLIQPTYLMTLIRLRALRIRPINAADAARRKVRLICTELAGLADDYQCGVRDARQAGRPLVAKAA